LAALLSGGSSLRTHATFFVITSITLMIASLRVPLSMTPERSMSKGFSGRRVVARGVAKPIATLGQN
jgi:hypothetical protein